MQNCNHYCVLVDYVVAEMQQDTDLGLGRYFCNEITESKPNIFLFFFVLSNRLCFS